MINVNGVYRRTTASMNVNGVWRTATPYQNVNGVWRHQDEIPQQINPDDIEYFKVVYKPARWIKYPGYPNLKFNDDLIKTIAVTGWDTKTINPTAKSLLFRFREEDHIHEGIYALEGTIYAVINGKDIPVSNIRNSQSAPQIDFKIDTTCIYETNGPYVMGWNRMFTTVNNLPHADGQHHWVQINQLQTLLPTYKRDKYADIICLIGIARDLHSHKHNMNGSHGALTHNYNGLFLNHKLMPFQLIYDPT